MDFYRESYFRDISARTSILEQRTFSADSVRAPIDKKFDVFLSYNINDIEVVKGIYYYLKKKGVSVYLDCIVDPDMKRSETDKQTAERIHKRLMNSNSLLYAQSPSAATSNWMPWELGVVDGHTHKCFIMPVSKDATPVTPRREYLLLYPYIKDGTNHEMQIITEGTIYGEQAKNFVNYIIATR